jgi:transcriptional regulator with XRE-family HTH domain
MSWRQLGSPQHEELRYFLIDRRKRAGLTQQQVADRVGRPQRFISRIEQGMHRVTVVELLELAAAIGFDPMAALRRVAKAKG